MCLSSTLTMIERAGAERGIPLMSYLIQIYNSIMVDIVVWTMIQNDDILCNGLKVVNFELVKYRKEGKEDSKVSIMIYS